MESEQFDEAMTKSVAIIKAMAAVSKAQLILVSAGLRDLDNSLADVRTEMDAECKLHEAVIKQYTEVK